MGKERFWFGAALLFLPLLGLWLALPNPAETIEGGPLDGQITIHGRPMAGGWIVLYPEDNSCAAVTAPLNEQGEFHVSERQIWTPTPETRFLITLCPAPGSKASGKEISADASEIRRYMEPRTSNLAVRLGAQPATIHIHL